MLLHSLKKVNKELMAKINLRQTRISNAKLHFSTQKFGSRKQESRAESRNLEGYK